MAKTQLDKSIEDAGTAKTQLDKSITDGQTLRTELEEDITVGRNLKTELETAGKTAVKSIQDEAATQLSKVQHASDEIIADREQINQNKTDIEALDETLNANIPDDGAIGSKPWTSKHIIDMLCPPLEASGNPAQCYPVVGYPLGITVSWEPTQEGEGDPSPDNIRPIKGRDSVDVTRCGANLLDLSRCTAVGADSAYGLTVSIDGDYVSISGTPSISKDAPNTKFRILKSAQKELFALQYKAKAFMEAGEVKSISTIESDKSIVVTVALTKDTPVDIKLRIMYYIGDEPTEYTPYTGDTATLTLPETICGGSVDAVSGEGGIRWKIVTIDGTTLKFTERNMYWNLNANSALGIGNYYDTDGNTISSHFSRKFAGNVFNQFIYTTSDWMEGIFSSVDEFNTYLAAQYAAGTPVQVAYKLVAPASFSATGNASMPAISGINTVLTDADSAEVTGRAAPIKRITDLEDAVASMTTA